MAKTFTAPFGQTPKTLTAVATAALGGLGTDTVTGAVLVATAGADGALLTRVSAMPRGTVTASSLVMFISKDNGATMRLVDSSLMGAYTLAATTQIPQTVFSNYSDSAPLRLEAGDKVYVGSQVALAAGIVITANWMDY